MLINISIAAASATAGTDLFKDERNNVSSRPRVVTGIAVAGSAAALDAKVSLYIERTYVGSFYNTATGSWNRDEIVPLGNRYVPPGAKISCIVDTAPGTNPINIVLMGREM